MEIILVIAFLFFIGVFLVKGTMWIVRQFKSKPINEVVPEEVIEETKKEIIPLHKDIKNEFIQAHRRKQEMQLFVGKMNVAHSSMERKRRERRIKDFPEYIKWCKENRIAPMFKNDHGLDHVIG